METQILSLKQPYVSSTCLVLTPWVDLEMEKHHVIERVHGPAHINQAIKACLLYKECLLCSVIVGNNVSCSSCAANGSFFCAHM